MTKQSDSFSPYQLVRSDRRTLSIQVDQQGRVIIRAPLRMPEAEIRRFIDSRQSWIEQAKRKVQARVTAAPVLAAGQTLHYLGKPILVSVCTVKKPQLAGEILQLPQTGQLQAQMAKWLTAQAKEYLPRRVAYWSQVTGLAPLSVTIAAAKTRWGSMSSRKTMRLNRALMHCPPVLIDFVIVHELCHLVHMNHSRAFHGLVQRFLPNEKQLQEALKAYGGYLTLLSQG